MIKTPSALSTAEYSEYLLSSTPPNTALTLTITFQFLGTAISTPPNMQVISRTCSFVANFDFVRSTTVAPKKFVIFPP